MIREPACAKVAQNTFEECAKIAYFGCVSASRSSATAFVSELMWILLTQMRRFQRVAYMKNIDNS